MKIRIFFTVILISLSFPLFAKEPLFELDLRPEFGFLNGVIKEYAIDSACENDGHVVSRLDWTLKATPYAGLDAKATLFRYGFLNVAGKLGISNSNGVIEDYDWLNYLGGTNGYPASWKNDPATELTNYSRHTNVLQKYNDISLLIGGNIYLPQKITVSPFLGYHYDYIEMDAYDGYVSYKLFNWEEIEMTGRGIKYKQEANAFLLGVNVLVNTVSYFTFESSYRISPAAFSVKDIDYHYDRAQLFYDDLGSTFSFETKQNIFFNFNSKNTTGLAHSLGLTAFIHYVKYSEGSTSIGYLNSSGQVINGSVTKSDSIAATSRFLWNVAVIYQLKIR